jgi:endonuclease YncB( thermonuclease family)
MRRLLPILFLLLGLTASPLLAQKYLSGRVVGVMDGDTFKLLTQDSTLVKVRVANIDCPEKKQAFSKRAKQFTSDAIFNKGVQVEVMGTDRYGRTIGNVRYGKNLNLSEELLKHGLAWHFKRYSKDKSLQQMEDEARDNRVGLWGDPDPVAPWDWRKAH